MGSHLPRPVWTDSDVSASQEVSQNEPDVQESLDSTWDATGQLEHSMGQLNVESLDSVDMDEVLRSSFLRGLKLVKDKMLPMPVNVFYAQHLLTQKPSTIDLDIKRTSYKKVGVFLKAMQDDDLVTLTETQPGVLTLTAINRDHDALHNVKPLDECLGAVSPKRSIADCPVGYFGPPKIEEVRIISGPSSALFTKCGYRLNTCISQSESRKLVDQYVRDNGLQRRDDPSLVQLDSLLMKFCNPNLYTEAPESTLANPVYLMRFQQLFSCCLQQLPIVYLITPPEGAGSPIVWRKKHPPSIELSVAMKNGKQVTRVANLETFCIDPMTFAKRLQVTLACSSGPVDDPQHKDTMTIQAQGSHEAAISKLLAESYGIPKRHIKGYVEAKKSKSKR